VTQGRGLSAQDAESFEEADAAYRKGGFATALRLLAPLAEQAGYDRRDSASLIAAGTAMGMLVPPAIFMIVIAQAG
jgi:Tripartite ATP-independent periplasmic transporter, DctM component